MNEYKISGMMVMEPVTNGDVWTFLNHVESEIQNHNTFFQASWTNAQLEPYVDDEYPNADNENFLTLRIRGAGVIKEVKDGIVSANEWIGMMIIEIAEKCNLFVGGGIWLEVCDG